MYAITIALYHKELGSNPERISKKLIEHIPLLNCHDIGFPASFNDYIIFETLIEDIALNIFYVPSDLKTICAEYISSRNYTVKKQVSLLKITDNNEKWHFLALPSIPTDDGCLRPVKSFSKLMHGISSKNNGDFYCYGCFHSFRTQSVLLKHIELCKDNKFCKIELPKKGKNFKYHKPGSKSLKMNYVIYADFETLLIPYHTCDNNKDIITKNLNKHEVCGYSINVVSNHTKETKQTYYRGKDSLIKFCKEIREIGKKLFDTQMKPMKELNKKQQSEHDNATQCYICKKRFSTHKNFKKDILKIFYTSRYTCNISKWF